MNYEIEQQEWSDFFNGLNKRRYDWTTNVEILNGDIGDQTLSNGLPFNGVTLERNGSSITIGVSVGEGANLHQTHNIKDPTRVAFLPTASGFSEVLDIEEADGTKTLVRFIAPGNLIAGATFEAGESPA